MFKRISKRGDVSIVILVLLVTLVTATSLFIFITSSLKENVKISDAAIINKVKLQENSVEFQIKQAGEKAVIETYKDIIVNTDYIASPVVFVNIIEPEFTLLNKNLNENFKSKFTENFKKEFESYNFEEDYLKDTQSIVHNGFFDIYFDGEILIFSEDRQEFYEYSKETQVTYKPRIKLEFNLTKTGIENFEKLYNVKEKCKSEENSELIKQCFNNLLVNFNAEITQKQKSDSNTYHLVTLTSKNEFLINNKYEKISFSFVLV